MSDGKRRTLFIGCWQPFHNGHDCIIRQALDAGKPVLIAVRDVPTSRSAPFPSRTVQRMIREHYVHEDVKVVIIPDIESVNVGWYTTHDLVRYGVPDDAEAVSATRIRKLMGEGNTAWEGLVPRAVASEIRDWLFDIKVRPRLEDGFVIWLTGIPCSGKTTLVRGLETELTVRGVDRVKVLDGDELRQAITLDLGFSRENRDENVRRVSHLAKMLADAGVVVIVALVSPYREARRKARDVVGPEKFFEVHVDCSTLTAKTRDTKGMYEKAIRGEIQNFTGVSDPYEGPRLPPSCYVNTDNQSKAECVDAVIRALGRWDGDGEE